MIKSFVALFSFVAGVGMAAAIAEEAPADPRVQSIKQLSFMEGDWELETLFYDGDGNLTQQGKATMSGKKILDGVGFQFENRFPYAEDPAGFFGNVVIFSVDAENGALKGVSNNTLGNRKLLNQLLEEDVLSFETSGELFAGRPGVVRGRYFNISEDRFEYEQDYCPAADDAPCHERAFAYIATRVRE